MADVYFHCDEKGVSLDVLEARAFTYKNYSIEMHNHDFYEINVIISGKGTHCLEEGKFSVRTGDVFVIPPMLSHAYIDTEDLEVYHIILKETFVADMKKESEQIKGFVQFMEVEPFLRSNNTNSFFLHLNQKQFLQFKEEIEFIDDRVQEANANSAYIKYHSIRKLIYWFSGLLVEQEKNHKIKVKNNYELQIMRVLEYIHQYHFEGITIEKLCQLTYISRSTLLRSFNEICGVSPNVYINNFRCKKALELLEISKKSKTEIAHICGFYDLSHMERGIRKYLKGNNERG